MGHSIHCAALGTGFTFLMTALGAATVFFFAKETNAKFQCALIGFAAGVMTAASVWSLLLPAIEQAEGGVFPKWLPAAAGILLGMLFLGTLDTLCPKLQKKPRSEAYRQNALLIAGLPLEDPSEYTDLVAGLMQ